MLAYLVPLRAGGGCDVFAPSWNDTVVYFTRELWSAPTIIDLGLEVGLGVRTRKPLIELEMALSTGDEGAE